MIREILLGETDLLACDDALAAALNCEARPGEGCGTCAACERILGGRHPDVRTLERQGAARIIPIETIRTEVVPALAMPPHEAKARVFLIEETAALQPATANALLKTLEEPPLRTHFVLCTTAPDQLLPTIRSRCQRLSFQALSPDLSAELHGDSEGAAKLRESFAIPNKPKNLAETRKDWERDVPVWIKLAVDLGIKLD